MDSLILGVDSGTSGTKAVLFDLAGNVVAKARSGLSVLSPKPGWSEQPPLWWESLVDAVSAVLSAPGVDARAIRALGLTHQRHSFLPIDHEFRPLRNGILWSDVRCTQQIALIRERIGAWRTYELTGVTPGPWSVYKMAWIKDNEPDVYARTRCFVLIHDYLVYRLTGRLATTESAATMMGCLDIVRRNAWVSEILQAFGIPSSMLVDEIVPAGSELGRLTAEAAEATGLPEGTPVIAAAGDQPCGCLGVGVDSPNLVGINGGTSLTLETVIPSLQLDPQMSYVVEYSPLGLYAPECVIFSGISDLMNWFKDRFGGVEKAETLRAGVAVWDILYGLAQDVEPGAEGLLLFPFFQGTGAPYWDPLARGMVVGLRRGHGKPHLARAIMEGLAYESRRQIELMEKGTGEKISSIRMYGGSARSSVWNQIVADVTGREVVTTITEEATSLGAAICAASGAGLYDSIRRAVETMVRVKEVYTPRLPLYAYYTRVYSEVYRPFFDRVRDLGDRLTEISEGTKRYEDSTNCRSYGEDETL